MARHFGILVPSTNTTCEIEYCRLPAELQVHTGRLGKGGDTPFSPSKDADVAYQAKLLGDARVGRPLPDVRAGGRPGAESPQGVAGGDGDALLGRGDRTGPALLRDQVR